MVGVNTDKNARCFRYIW